MLELLYINWTVDPVMFHIGSFGLRWYSFGFLFAFVLGYILMNKMFKKEGVDSKYVDSLVLYMFLAVLIGARLGHCIFYEPGYYLTGEHWWEMIVPVDSAGHFTGYQGLASHGASIGILVGFWLYSRNKHMNAWWVLDRFVIVVALGGAFIRLGNLMNSEIWGYETTMPWGFVFERDHSAGMVPRHPSQLYEAICYLILFAVCLLIYRKKEGKMRVGTMFGWWLVALFTIRLLLEFTKVPSVDKICGLAMGQVLSIPFILFGVAMVIMSKKGIISQEIYTKKATAAEKAGKKRK